MLQPLQELRLTRRCQCSVALLATVLIAAFAAPAALTAQPLPTDSLPFRPGQWAVQFSTWGGGGLGALRFRSPSSAWVADGMVEARDYHSSDGRRREAMTSVRAGLRSYRTVVPRVARYHGGGITATYAHYETELEPEQHEYKSRGGGGGLYGELGAEFLITAHLSLGANASASAIVGGRTVTNPSGGYKEFGWSVAAGGLRALATLYF